MSKRPVRFIDQVFTAKRRPMQPFLAFRRHIARQLRYACPVKLECGVCGNAVGRWWLPRAVARQHARGQVRRG